MRVTVTGGAGFIGAHVVRTLLERGHAVTVLDDLSLGSRAAVPDGATVEIGDVRDEKALDRAGKGRAGNGADAIVHLAAISSVVRSFEDPEGTGSINAGGAASVAAWAARNRARTVFSSSAAVYGDAARLPVSEDLPPGPLSPYAGQKAAAEAAFLALPGGTALRFFNVYGPGQDPESDYAGVISLFARRVSAGEPVTIFGDGGQTRDFVFVEDVARAVVAAVERTSREPLLANVATGTGVRIDDLAHAVARAWDREVVLDAGPAREGDVRHSVASIEVARRELNWSPRVGLDEGLRRLREAS